MRLDQKKLKKLVYLLAKINNQLLIFRQENVLLNVQILMNQQIYILMNQQTQIIQNVYQHAQMDIILMG